MTFIRLLFVFVVCHCFYVVTSQLRSKRFQRISQEPKRPILPLMGQKIQKLRSIEVCYESVGCFDIPRHHNPLQKLPQNPQILETQFFLFRRDINFTYPELLAYNDHLKSLKRSKFNPNDPVKILVHGYMTKWNQDGAMAGVQAYLDIGPTNIILVDWEKGAKGPRYSNAAANTELVGRQLGLLLLDLLSVGTSPHQIHMIGFSLGAHVAACASEVLKEKGLRPNRITGLDPASPLFKLNHFRDKKKKLDITDADYVDVIHTDGSMIFTDGFGLLEPIGHVDFFPNGGREQPGCNDVKNSVVVSHFEKNLDRQIACSHIRAYNYFLETLLEKASVANGVTNSSKCQFMAYNCPGGPRDFALGKCFPSNSSLDGRQFPGGLGQLGEDSKGNGAMFLVTKGAPPYCGMQIQIIVDILPQTRRTKGYITININGDVKFSFLCDIPDVPHTNRKIYGISAVNFDNFNSKSIIVNISYSKINLAENNIRHSIHFNKIQLKTMIGTSWQHCGPAFIQQNLVTIFKLSIGDC